MRDSKKPSKKPTRSQALTAQRYKQLRHDVQQLVSRSDAMSHKNRVGTLWRLGHRITKERLAQGTGYHNQRVVDPHGNVLKRPDTASYLYAASVVNIIDGDTVDLRIDLGFHTERIGRFRLADIDTPELSTRRGGFETRPVDEARAARDFMFNRLLTAKTIVVKTQRTDQHGRYVTHLFYSPSNITIDDCFRDGTYLNAELIEAGHAVKVTG